MNDGVIAFPGELFHVCSLKYPHLMHESHGTLWHRLIGRSHLETSHQTLPLLLSDSIALLIRIMLSLPYPIAQGNHVCHMHTPEDLTSP